MRPLALTQLALLSVGLVACHDVTGPSSIPTALLNIVDPDREPGRLSAVPGLSFRAQSKNWEPGHCQDSLATKPSPEAHARGARSSVNRPPAPRCRSEVAPPVGEPRTRLTSLRCRDSGRARLKKPRAVVDMSRSGTRSPPRDIRVHRVGDLPGVRARRSGHGRQVAGLERRGTYPMWARTVHELFFETLENQVIVAPSAVTGASFAADTPRVWSDAARGQRQQREEHRSCARPHTPRGPHPGGGRRRTAGAEPDDVPSELLRRRAAQGAGGPVASAEHESPCSRCPSHAGVGR